MKQQNHELTTGYLTSHKQRCGALLAAFTGAWIFLAASPATASTAYIRGVCVLPFGGCNETGLPPFSVSAASPNPVAGQSEVSGSGEWVTSTSHSFASGSGGDARVTIVPYDEIHFRNATGTYGDVVWAEISYELSVATATKSPPNSSAGSTIALSPRVNWVGFTAPKLQYRTDTGGWATPSRYTYTFWWNTDTAANPDRPLGLEVWLENNSWSMWYAGYDEGYGLPSSDTIASATWSISVITPGASLVSASGASYSAVPLPGTGVLFGSALLVLQGLNRKSRVGCARGFIVRTDSKA